jgi:hypothetical protein
MVKRRSMGTCQCWSRLLANYGANYHKTCQGYRTWSLGDAVCSGTRSEDSLILAALLLVHTDSAWAVPCGSRRVRSSSTLLALDPGWSLLVMSRHIGEPPTQDSADCMNSGTDDCT